LGTLSEDYLYLMSTDEMSTLYAYSGRLSVVLLGTDADHIVSGRNWQAIVIDNSHAWRNIYERIQNIFEKYNVWSEEIMECVLRQKSIQALMSSGAALLTNPIALFDISFKYVAKGGALDTSSIEGSVWVYVLGEGRSPINLAPPAIREEFYQRLESEALFTMQPQEEFRDQNWLVVPVFRHSQLSGFLAACDINSPFSKGQCSLAKYFNEQLGLYLELKDEIPAQEINAPYYIDRILQGYSIDENIVEYHMKKFFWEADNCFKLAYICRRGVADSSPPLYSIMLQLKDVLQRCLLFPYENGVVLIVYDKELGRENRESDFQIELDRQLEAMNLHAGVSMSFSSFMDIKYAFIQGKAALKFASLSATWQQRFHFEECYSKYIVESLNETTGLKCLCYHGLSKASLADQGASNYLISTLRSYLWNGRNISKTAENLFVHRNTLAYRIKKIETDLGLNLDEINEEQFFMLYLSCLILS